MPLIQVPGGLFIRDTAALQASLPRGTTANNIIQARGDPGDAPASNDLNVRAPYFGSFAEGVLPTPPRWIVTSDQWLQQVGPVALSLNSGPSQAAWSFGLRADEEPNQGGRARYAQARPDPTTSGGLTWFDNPKVTLSFQSGNLLPIYTDGGRIAKVLPPGLEDYYRFLSLVNQSPVIESGPNQGQKNFLWCFYTSRVYPSMLLKGYVQEVINVTESADPNPNTITWDVALSVWYADPAPWDFDATSQAYGNVMWL